MKQFAHALAQKGKRARQTGKNSQNRRQQRTKKKKAEQRPETGIAALAGNGGQLRHTVVPGAKRGKSGLRRLVGKRISGLGQRGKHALPRVGRKKQQDAAHQRIDADALDALHGVKNVRQLFSFRQDEMPVGARTQSNAFGSNQFVNDEKPHARVPCYAPLRCS